MARPRTPAGRARRTAERLAVEFPGTARDLCALDHSDPFHLLAATILSAQCTDERVNLTTPALFSRFPDAFALAAADPAVVEEIIHSTGFYKSKAKNIQGAAKILTERFKGKVPETIEELILLPGVARKTANVVLGSWFGIASGVVVDTHVLRLSKRLELTRHDDPIKVEKDLQKVIPQDRWIQLSHELIHHGRQVCVARRPRCTECGIEPLCNAVDKTWSST